MASTILKITVLTFLMITFVLAQRQRPLYPEGHPPPSNRRPDYFPGGKPGHCPPLGGRRPGYGRGRTCGKDDDCPDLDKCCNISGRNTCVPPVFA